MIAFAPCKINLGLHILRQRADKYHDLQSVFYPVPLHDIVEALKADQGFQFSSSGIQIPGNVEDNLVYKAWQIMQQNYGIGGLQLHLHKQIPFGAGLGGGSSDAAHTLKLINQLYELNLSTERLKKLALQLGADCPFFIESQAVYVEGIGEKFSPVQLNLSGWHLVLVKPPKSVSTAQAYQHVTKDDSRLPVSDLVQQPIEQWQQHLKNDFQDSVGLVLPEIHQIVTQLQQQGAVYAAMSGSGSAVFALFRQSCQLPAFPADYFIWQGEL